MRSISLPLLISLHYITFVQGLGRQEQVMLNYISSVNLTNTYQANPLYSPCTCDLTALSCDDQCCCDSDCSFALRAQWVSNEQCIDVNYNNLNPGPL